jgi:hypothetical protein
MAAVPGASCTTAAVPGSYRGTTAMPWTWCDGRSARGVSRDDRDAMDVVRRPQCPGRCPGLEKVRPPGSRSAAGDTGTYTIACEPLGLSFSSPWQGHGSRNAMSSGPAMTSGNAMSSGTALASGNALAPGNAMSSGTAKSSGTALSSGNALASGNTLATGTAGRGDIPHRGTTLISGRKTRSRGGCAR